MSSNYYSNITDRDYQPVEEYFGNDLRIIVKKADPNFYSVHLIRTKDEVLYSPCVCRITNTEDWESVYTVLDQLQAIREKVPYVTITTGNNANIRIISFQCNIGTTDNKFLTILSRGVFTKKLPRDYHTKILPIFRKPDKNGVIKEETDNDKKHYSQHSNEKYDHKTKRRDHSRSSSESSCESPREQRHSNNNNSTRQHTGNSSVNVRRSRSRSPQRSTRNYNTRHRRTQSQRAPNYNNEGKLRCEVEAIVLEDKHLDFILNNVYLAKLRPVVANK